VGKRSRQKRPRPAEASPPAPEPRQVVVRLPPCADIVVEVTRFTRLTIQHVEEDSE
jgi:hypothetical protein